jgi:Nucleotidyl transferase AbiEii toxin, Type IV TA system
MSEIKKNLPVSIHRRLLNLARSENRPLNELLQYYAIERFLYRLGNSVYRTQFILKGGQMLKVWNAPTARPTIDIDLLGKVNNSIENLEKIVSECCQTKSSDGVVFDQSSIKGEAIRKDAEYQGVRITLNGTLGKIRLHLQIDFGFGDAVVPEPIEIELPQLLDLGKPKLYGYTPESSIAEKFQAMVALDLTNSRMKDFYDIWLLSKTLEFDNKVLSDAIKETFKRRETPLPTSTPRALTTEFTNDKNKQTQWKAFLRKNRLDEEIELEAVVKEIEEFLMQALSNNR